MRDLIQALGNLQRIYLLSIGGPCESGYRFQIQRGIQQLSADLNLYKSLGIPIDTYDYQDLSENVNLIGIKLLYVYHKHRDEAERNKATFDFDELENIYYAASAFICTAQDWKKASIIS